MDLTAIIVVALAVAFPLTMISAAEMYKRRLAFKERELQLMAGRDADKAAQYAAQVGRLEERMRVLERIVTDKGANLAQQIESLRDEPAPRLATPEKELN